MSRLENLIEEIERTFNMGALGFSAEKMAKFVIASDNRAPLTLAYAGKDGKIILDERIHNLSSLVGVKIGCDADNPEVSIVILFDTIKSKDLEAMGCKRSITLAKLRKFAKQKIHPAAKVINKSVATMLWNNAFDYYTLNYMLSKKGVEIPGIMVLQSFEDSDANNSNLVRWNHPRTAWVYEEGLDKCAIEFDTPFLCYFKVN